MNKPTKRKKTVKRSTAHFAKLSLYERFKDLLDNVPASGINNWVLDCIKCTMPDKTVAEISANPKKSDPAFIEDVIRYPYVVDLVVDLCKLNKLEKYDMNDRTAMSTGAPMFAKKIANDKNFVKKFLQIFD